MVKKAKPVFVVGSTYRSSELGLEFKVCKIGASSDLIVVRLPDGTTHNLSLRFLRKRLCSGDVYML